MGEVKQDCETKLRVKKTYTGRGDKPRMVVEYICKNTGHKLDERDIPVKREELENEELLREKLGGVLRRYEERRQKRKNSSVKDDYGRQGFELDSYVEKNLTE